MSSGQSKTTTTVTGMAAQVAAQVAAPNAVQIPKNSTRRIATIKVTGPIEDEPVSPTRSSRSGSCRLKSGLRETACPLMVTGSPTSTARVIEDKPETSGAASKQRIGSGSGWKVLRAAAARERFSSLGSSPSEPEPSCSKSASISSPTGTTQIMISERSAKTLLVESVSPSAYELAQREAASGKEQWNRLKSKLTALRKKSTSEPEPEPPLPTSSLSVPRSDRSQRGSNASITSTSSLRTPGRQTRSNSQDEGIVCKKDDLLALLTQSLESHGSKRESLSKKNSAESGGAASPTPSTSSLRKFRMSTSDADQPSSSNSSKRASFNSGQSSRKGSANAIAAIGPSATPNDTSTSDEPDSPNPPLRSPAAVPIVVVDDGHEKVHEEDQPSCSDAKDDDKERSEVKWDEAETVDAVLLGDAIEAFLKGISEPPPIVEKRVSFKKC